MDRIDLALLLARRATLLEARSAEPWAPVVAVADRRDGARARRYRLVRWGGRARGGRAAT